MIIPHEKFVVWHSSCKEAIVLDKVIQTCIANMNHNNPDDIEFELTAYQISKEGDRTLMEWLRAPFPLDAAIYYPNGKIAYIIRESFPILYEQSWDNDSNLRIRIKFKTTKIDKVSEGWERKLRIREGIEQFHNHTQ